MGTYKDEPCHPSSVQRPGILLYPFSASHATRGPISDFLQLQTECSPPPAPGLRTLPMVRAPRPDPIREYGVLYPIPWACTTPYSMCWERGGSRQETGIGRQVLGHYSPIDYTTKYGVYTLYVGQELQGPEYIGETVGLETCAFMSTHHSRDN
jgi:hypothetical protein